MWDSIGRPWQVAYEQAWEAFSKGSFPIGASIADEDGEIISFGRNRLRENTAIFENKTLNPKIAHAEMEALLKLDVSKYPDVKKYTLYATAEPCPMCMGMIVMSNFRKLKIAARDSYCGKAHWCNDDPYIASKKIEVDFENGVHEIILPTVGMYMELRECGGELDGPAKMFAEDYPTAYKTAKILYAEARLNKYVGNNTPFRQVFDEIYNLSNSITGTI